MKGMNYKGYFTKIEFDSEDRIFVGHVIGIRDVVGFHGESVAELEATFQEAVDNYLTACEKLGQEPNKPYSGGNSCCCRRRSQRQEITQWAAAVLDRAAGTA